MPGIEIITIYCENYRQIKEVPRGKEDGTFKVKTSGRLTYSNDCFKGLIR
jgi:hypothetical protein